MGSLSLTTDAAESQKGKPGETASKTVLKPRSESNNKPALPQTRHHDNPVSPLPSLPHRASPPLQDTPTSSRPTSLPFSALFSTLASYTRPSRRRRPREHHDPPSPPPVPQASQHILPTRNATEQPRMPFIPKYAYPPSSLSPPARPGEEPGAVNSPSPSFEQNTIPHLQVKLLRGAAARSSPSNNGSLHAPRVSRPTVNTKHQPSRLPNPPSTFNLSQNINNPQLPHPHPSSSPFPLLSPHKHHTPRNPSSTTPAARATFLTALASSAFDFQSFVPFQSHLLNTDTVNPTPTYSDLYGDTERGGRGTVFRELVRLEVECQPRPGTERGGIGSVPRQTSSPTPRPTDRMPEPNDRIRIRPSRPYTPGRPTAQTPRPTPHRPIDTRLGR